MRIVVAAESKNVSMHFGHCERFALFDIENGEIKNELFIPNPGHRLGFLPGFLKEQGAECVIAGGMGASAVGLFNQNGINVITGASGFIKNLVKRYIEGTLISTGSVCEKHEHKGHYES
ncbi:dinitrogenase iron-molybdenum cofactor biosynthesis protein [Thermoanaerobacter kivui]|uniref:Dinitrogenase iron-molybdenum cofactor biosynthesis protein n=1 Tax=Thermoanaerobacter kivui TaxID=2325 RepID=A0A097AS38_THEKI|nr:NifB/NifX family molybdenum-iron cluster-binding protein [Thermoanaerobacter kivui]AIS52640.1 dinitrogenase iron-molybdenum cofactor biosynthesis protein [Thermoanaerobacter kivui]